MKQRTSVRNVVMSGNKYTVVSTFAGCGGSSLGYKLAEFHELLAIDFDENAVETFRLNFPEVPVWLRDITTVSAQEILEFTGLKVGELDVFDGSPPCQGFSTAGRRKINDPRNRLFEAYVDLIKGLQPKVFVMENVSGMVKGKMRGTFKEILRTLKSCGYIVKVKLLNAKYYQVPQSRQRLFFIGVREDIGIEPTFPLPNLKVIPVKDVIAEFIDVPYPELAPRGMNDTLWDLLRPGEQGSAVYPNKYFNHVKISWHKPCPTITKSVGLSYTCLMHPYRKRLLSIDEIKRLASFPDDFQFVGKFEDQWARIGNAVMPKMMEAVARSIKKNVLDVYYGRA
ncbi:MAG: DNA cytosine methyltransferase [bacterium]|nr:DNA cytosine methyltransferase [bacterium]